ncbi:MAG: hypothetical protein AABX30_00525 [Nanoarchaeota archaeon]
MAISKRREKFFDVEIPSIGKETQVQAFEKTDLNGKFIRYDLTRLLRGKNAEMQLVIKVEGEKITTIPREIKVLPYFIRRAMRKGINYVEDSFSADSQNAKLKIKPFLITRRKVSRAIRKALREKCKEEIINYVKDKDFDEIFDDILKNRFQKSLSQKLKKIYPLSLCEIRHIKVEKYF